LTKYQNRQMKVAESASLDNGLPIVAMAGIADIRQRKTRASVLSALELIPSSYHALVTAYALQRPQLFERFQLRALLSVADLPAVEKLIGPHALSVALKAHTRPQPEAEGVTLARSVRQAKAEALAKEAAEDAMPLRRAARLAKAEMLARAA
jgi:hypothetical protein